MRFVIVIAGTARIQPHGIEDAVQAGSAMAAASRAEPGCHDYRFAVDIDDPTVVHLFEQWDDQAALDAHFATDHFGAFSAAIAELIAGTPTFTRYVVAESGPLFG